MTNTRIALFAAVAASLIAGCAAQDTSVPERSHAPDADPPLTIGEVKDGRTRAKAHTDLAAAYYELGNIGVALEEVRIALTADSSYAPAYNVQGLVRMELRDNVAAEASFRRGLSLAPGDSDLNHNYGWFLCQSGREDQSVQWFMNAVRNPLYGTPSKSHAAAGRCLQKANPVEASRHFDRALRLDPYNLQALLPYAEILYRRGQLQQAKELVGRFNKLLPDPTAESLWLALRIERKLGDRLAETSLATQLRRRFPESSEYQTLLRGNFN